MEEMTVEYDLTVEQVLTGRTPYGFILSLRLG